MSATCDQYIFNAVVFYCLLARLIDNSQLICTENHLGLFHIIRKKTKTKLNWQHYKELPNVLIINNYDNMIDFASFIFILFISH